MSNVSLIGPQILSEDMLDCAFHYRSDVLDTIENFRSNAENVATEFAEALRRREQDAIMYSRGFNNTISILGSRGTGKTSIIMTLQKLLSEDGDSGRNGSSFRNIMMPILIPQDIEPEQKLLSCIISQLLKKADMIEQDIQENGLDPDRIWRPWRSNQQARCCEEPFRTCMDRLLSAFELRFQSGLAARSADSDQVYYYMDSVKRDADLLVDMLKLISMIVDYYRYQADECRKNDINTEPLLFFTIDDLDLAPHRSSEVLDLVLRYLQHPNVVVICGWNHELFQNHLCMDILNTQGVLAADLLNVNFSFDDVFMYRYRSRTTALDSARRLAVDNLKKAFPPAQRFEIRGLSTRERAFFPYSFSLAEKEQDFQKETLFYWVEETISRCLKLSGRSFAGQNFLRDHSGEPLYVYMRIFDNKVRGLANSRRAFESLAIYLSRKQEEPGALKEVPPYLDVTSQIKILFDAILFSNTRFLPYRRGLRDLVQIKKVALPYGAEKGTLDYYCNFQAVRQTLEKYRDAQNRKEYAEDDSSLFSMEYVIQQKFDYFPNLVVDVFLLLNFMENFLHTITGTRGSSHGGLAFSAYLNELHPPIDFTSRSDELLPRAILLSGVSALKLFPDTADFALNVAILDAYEQAGFEETQYYFTGFLSLMRLFDMVKQLLSSEDKLSMDAVRNVLQADPAWLSAILRLLDALQPREENVKRLAAYISILEASGNHEVAVDMAVQNAGRPEDDLQFSGTSGTDFTDDALDILVHCLRTIDKNRSYFLQCRQRGIQGQIRKNSTEDQIAYRRAVTYCALSGKYPWYDPSLDSDTDTVIISDPKEFQTLLAPLAERKKATFTDAPEAEISKIPTDGIMMTVSRALELADNDVKLLLHDLRVRMRMAFVYNYRRSSDSLPHQRQYLLQASVAVRKYIERWELTPGAWGQREIKAASELIGIFQNYLMEDIADEMLDIMNLGPTLGEERRDRYNNKIGQLRQKVSNFNNIFTVEEFDRIRDDFIILSEAPKQIRRGLRVEEDIYNTVMGIGVLVAHELSNVCYKLFRRWSNQSDQRLSVWPVGPDYDEALIALARYLRRLLPQKREPHSSMFDVEYSDIQLYLQRADK